MDTNEKEKIGRNSKKTNFDFFLKFTRKSEKFSLITDLRSLD